MIKDYSLLRPFNLEAAKAGEPTCRSSGDVFDFVAESTDGEHCFKNIDGALFIRGEGYVRMKPLAWVEGKPVYKGDELWHCTGVFVTAVSPAPEGINGFVASDGDDVNSLNLTWTPPSKMEVISPKTKKVKLLGWFNGFELTWTVEIDKMRDEWKRVPSEDKEIEVEL